MKKKKRLVAFIIIAMRITMVQIALITFLLSTVYAATTSAQILEKTVAVQSKNLEIRKLISIVQKQIGIKFIFSVDVIKGERKVSCDIKDKTLSYFLDAVLRPLDIGYRVFDNQILLIPLSEADKPVTSGADTTDNGAPRGSATGRVITGRVLSPDGQPLRGASVKVKGSAKGTTTDSSGDFRIKR